MCVSTPLGLKSMQHACANPASVDMLSCFQVTVEYKRDPECPGALIPVRVHTILISTQHDAEVTNEKIRAVSATCTCTLCMPLLPCPPQLRCVQPCFAESVRFRLVAAGQPGCPQ